MPTLSGTVQIHAPLNWLFFDSGKLTFCLCSCQRAIGSTKGPAESVRPKAPRDTNIWLGGWYFHAFSVSLSPFPLSAPCLVFPLCPWVFQLSCFLNVSSPRRLETAFSNQQGTYWQSEPPECSECEDHTHRKYQCRRRFVFQDQQDSKL